jgi:hypothetical protein
MPPFKAKDGAPARDSAGAPQRNQGPSSPAVPVADGEARVPLQAPEGTTSCKIDHVEYSVVDGRVAVLERHIEPLRAIGFSFVVE